MPELTLIPLVVVPLVTLASAICDLRWFRIPNQLTLTLLVSGWVYHAWNPMPHALGHSLLGTLVAAVPLLILHLRGAMGAGDVKLMAGIGAWWGAWAAINILIVSGLAGGVFALVLVIRRHRHTSGGRPDLGPAVLDHIDTLAAQIASPTARSRLIPFGVMIAVGVFATFSRTAWLLLPVD